MTPDAKRRLIVVAIWIGAVALVALVIIGLLYARTVELGPFGGVHN